MKILSVAFLSLTLAMDNPVAFSDCLTRLGFNDATCALFVQEGFVTMNNLLAIPSSEIDKMVQHFSRWKPREAPADEEVEQDERVTVPFLAVRQLKALRCWADYRLLRGQQPNPALFVGAGVVARFSYRLTELEEAARAKKEDADYMSTSMKLNKFEEWPVWIEGLETLLDLLRNVAAGTPLIYIIRDHAEVTQEMLTAEYDSVDEDLIATSLFEGETFVADNKRVFDIMKPLILDGDGWDFVKSFRKTRDGRGAFMALKAQAEGRSAITTRKQKAYALIASATYTGKGKFSFDQYVGRHQKAHNTLLELDEPVPESKKVRDFMDGIHDSKLETDLTNVLGDRTKLESSEECQQYLKTILMNAKMRPSTADCQVAVAQVQRQKDRQNAKHKAKKKKAAAAGAADDGKPSGLSIHAGYYTPKDFNKLKPSERAEVQRLQKEQAGRNVSVVAPQVDVQQAEELQHQ